MMASTPALAQPPFDERELVLEDQGVDRDVRAGPSAVNSVADGRQSLEREVGRARPRVEPLVEPEVHRVSPRAERRIEAVVVSRRGEDLGNAHALAIARKRGCSQAGN
jgi:hypothetical protein